MTNPAYPDPVAYPFNVAEGLELDAAYALARATPGLVRVRLPYGEPAWLATRYADARLVLGSNVFSRARAVVADAPRLTEAKQVSSILSMDPPEHTRLRTLGAKAFTMRRVELSRPRIRELANELVDRLLTMPQPVDLVENYALPLPVQVICELLGVPAADRRKFRVWSDAVMSTSGISAARFAVLRTEFQDYIRALIEHRRAEPRDDLMTALIEARDERDRLSENELVELCRTILGAGYEATAAQLSNFVYVLLDNPDRLAELRADPGLLPAAVEELSRFIPLGGVATFPRYATEDIDVGGVLVRAGEPVLVAIGAADRDPLRFPAPDQLRFDRDDNQHIAFGHGPHRCLGTQLARVELQEGLGALIDRLPGLRLAGDVGWKRQMIARGPRTMPIGW
ncbi:cytochrome P450 [Actinophytocola sediminis]